jgi:hypothetical protein
MAYKMQTSAPELTDLTKEDPKTLEMYGVKPGEASFAMNCLLARRLVERGVRFVNLYHARLGPSLRRRGRYESPVRPD